MKLDNKLLKEMIAEALEEASKYADQMSRDAQKKDKDDKEEENKKRVNVSGGRELEPEELQEQEATPEVAKLQSVAADAKQKAAEAEKKARSAEAEEAQKAAEEAAQKAGATMEESFQLTKGRLRQIIREELISAKKQGLL